MSETSFGKPSETVSDSGEKFNPKDHQGRVVMFCGIEKEKVETSFGAAIVAACSLILVLDDPAGTQVFTGAWVFGASLAPTLYRAKADVVVGVLGVGTAKPGKSAPWMLLDASDSQLEAARAVFMDKVERSGTEYFWAPDRAPF